MTRRRATAGRLARLGRRPRVRRFAGYGLGSVVAAATSEMAFVLAYGWGHTGALAASACGFVGGAVPNYILNRRWAWRQGGGRSRRSEVALYSAVALSSFVVAALGTRWAERWARHLTSDTSWRVVVIAGAYLSASGVVFLAKFVLYDLVVFTRAPSDREGGGAPSAAASTRS